MAWLSENGIDIHYEVLGEGFPVLLFAPGGMRSEATFWQNSPWDPRVSLAPEFRVIAMDQRNAGQSSAPITALDNWDTYTEDHLRLLDALSIDQCHVVGGCIGGAFAFNLMARAPDRVAAAVIQQTIGFDQNRDVFYAMFDGWAGEQQAARPDLPQATLDQFRANLYDHEAVFSVSYDVIAGLPHPLLILKGDDQYHPATVSNRIEAIATHSRMIEDWKSDGVKTALDAKAFLMTHTPNG